MMEHLKAALINTAILDILGNLITSPAILIPLLRIRPPA